ncbi:hypothetical protein L2E82_12833 [Cichorium intybus]|uniref:Uncharacterized protein n=1 Tax=Cichorium intybus TaxID=13427 RepID=A0ACB9GHA7_CICIN|nr:hypothetical protein L2E82_12833 [Cichorium intybus]
MLHPLRATQTMVDSASYKPSEDKFCTRFAVTAKGICFHVLWHTSLVMHDCVYRSCNTKTVHKLMQWHHLVNLTCQLLARIGHCTTQHSVGPTQLLHWTDHQVFVTTWKIQSYHPFQACQEAPQP